MCSLKPRVARGGMRPERCRIELAVSGLKSSWYLRRATAPRVRAGAGRPKEERSLRTLEHQYAVYFMSRFPVVATYLGGSAFDPALASIDGKLRDYSPQALHSGGRAACKFHDRFTALAPETLSAARRIDRDVALAEIEFLLHQHQVRRHQERASGFLRG
jgi:uncharacterized protein (DUF885 family)